MTRDIDKEISELENKIIQLKKEKKKAAALTPEKRLAEYLHKQYCHWNHTDGCGWHYHKPEDPKTWTGCDTHKRYLKWAEDMIFTIRSYNPALSTDAVLELAFKINDRSKHSVY